MTDWTKPKAVYVIVGPEGNLGGWHSTFDSGYHAALECVHGFQSEADAWRFILESPNMPEELREQHERAMRAAWRVVELPLP